MSLKLSQAKFCLIETIIYFLGRRFLWCSNSLPYPPPPPPCPPPDETGMILIILIIWPPFEEIYFNVIVGLIMVRSIYLRRRPRVHLPLPLTTSPRLHVL